jgi:hypothetical protein
LGTVLNRKPLVCVQSAHGGLGSGLAHFKRENSIVSALYPQKNGAIILRAYENFGARTCCALHLDGTTPYTCFETDIDGVRRVPVDAQAILFRPYEIKTFALVPSHENC